MAQPQPPESRPAGFVPGNVYDKYRTGNPIYQRLMRGFLVSCRALLAGVRAERVLEVGCGPGDLAHWLLPSLEWTAHARYLGTDVSVGEVALARQHHAPYRFLPASVYQLPVPDASYDCVLACEILEHLRDPVAALDEIQRVATGHLLISVPWEPVWCLLNLARGKYWSAWGNTPGHLQHFSRARIRQLVASRFAVIAERHPLPWTVLLARAGAPRVRRSLP